MASAFFYEITTSNLKGNLLELCQTPQMLQQFFALLSPEIIEPLKSEGKILVHAGVGKVEWIWLENIGVFCVDGMKGYIDYLKGGAISS